MRIRDPPHQPSGGASRLSLGFHAEPGEVIASQALKIVEVICDRRIRGVGDRRQPVQGDGVADLESRPALNEVVVPSRWRKSEF